jgi:hypothetical protein
MFGTAVSATAGAVAAGAPPAQQHVSIRVTYDCRYSSRTVQVPVTVAARFPATATVGQPIQPADARLTVQLPPAVVTGLAAARPGSVGGTAQLTLPVTQGKTKADATWAGLTWVAAPLPASGGLTLAASGPVPALRVSAAGRVAFTVAGLRLTLAPRPPGSTTSPPATTTTTPPATAPPPATTAPATATTTPATTTPSATTLQLSCRPAAGQQVVLAGIAARAAAPNATASAAARHKFRCPQQPKGGYKLNPRFRPPRVPHGIVIHRPTPSLGCAYVVGYADVRKLNGASKLGPAVVALTVALRVDYNFAKSDYFQEDSAGILDYRLCPACKVRHGLPPVKATFLTFGFMPTTAKMQLTEIGNLDLFGIGTTSALNVSESYAEMSLHISDVRVNGSPLNVGASCRAARPFTVELVGHADSHPAYSLQGGGPLTGNVRIPRFTGCGVTENLDSLFTAAISGSRNFTELTQGNLCTPASDSGCPARRPRPLH